MFRQMEGVTVCVCSIAALIPNVDFHATESLYSNIKLFKSRLGSHSIT